MKRFSPPFRSQTFTSHQDWVNKASRRLTSHPDYNNTEHGDAKGWRGNHFTALCFDSLGRRMWCGADFARAEKENAFPVFWIWPDQITTLLSELERMSDRYENWKPISHPPEHLASNAMLSFYFYDERQEATWWNGTWAERPANALMWCAIVMPSGPHADQIRAAEKAAVKNTTEAPGEDT